MNQPVQVRLSPDQALVLFEFFGRFQQTNRLRMLNNAEFVALSEVAAQIESSLFEPLQRNYAELLAAAQSRVGGGYDGLAPGVEP